MFKIFTNNITSAIVLSKVLTTKMFKPKGLCYWQIDSPYLKN